MIETLLKNAFEWRKTLGFLNETNALRIFYGPGETEHAELKHLSIDLYGDHAWITIWKKVSARTLEECAKALHLVCESRLCAVVLMDRSTVASESEVVTLTGVARSGRYAVQENGTEYLVQMEKTKHPGLFLDHAPLREWLKKSQKEKTVLNLFSYTGSLSLAAAHAGAKKVTTLDLSKTTIEWAKENWAQANLPIESGDFIYGDVFEWLPKFKKRNEAFDTILCDPPSFSRSKSGVFSTNKDSGRLHEQIFPILKSGGVLVTSINSENYSERSFLKDIENAAAKTGSKIRVLRTIDLPETFPTPPELNSRYLKGFYLLKE